jgi:hypothetical protein
MFFIRWGICFAPEIGNYYQDAVVRISEIAERVTSFALRVNSLQVNFQFNQKFQENLLSFNCFPLSRQDIGNQINSHTNQLLYI